MYSPSSNFTSYVLGIYYISAWGSCTSLSLVQLSGKGCTEIGDVRGSHIGNIWLAMVV